MDSLRRTDSPARAVPRRRAARDAARTGATRNRRRPVEAHVDKLKELESVGVTQFNIYLMCGEEERQVAEYAEHVIPHFQ